MARVGPRRSARDRRRAWLRRRGKRARVCCQRWWRISRDQHPGYDHRIGLEQYLNNGLNAVQFWSGAASSAAGGLLVGGTQDNGTLALQRIGNGWWQWFGGDGGSTAIDPTNPTLWYGEYTNAAVFRTLD